ncbi:MAG: hypothetical protein M3Q63_00295 [bacterium]|nr:hypothetical protein [bacterium]
MIKLVSKSGPLFQTSLYKDTKDPCGVFDGNQWHIFGSGGSVRTETWKILHATAQDAKGPWVEQNHVILDGVAGDHVAAPGVLYDKGENLFHMFVQTDFLAVGGTIEYLTSQNGNTFKKINTALTPLVDTGEAGLYDPHPAVIHGEKYITYSGTPRVQSHGTYFVSQPDLYLAKSTSKNWEGPWERLGKIVDHEHIKEHHNQKDHPEYEWGIEGPQLIELPQGKILLNATSFSPQGRYGTRQRVFFAIADNVAGPYKSLGIVLDENLEEWESGENGHATGVVQDSTLLLFYQARAGTNTQDILANDWQYGIAHFDLTEIFK